MTDRAIVWLCPVQGVDPGPGADASFVCLHSTAELIERLPPGTGARFDAVVVDALPIEPLDYDPAQMVRLLLPSLGEPPNILVLIMRPDVASDPIPAQAAFCYEIYAMFGHTPKFVVQLGASYQARNAPPKRSGDKPSDLARITRWEEIARYVGTLVAGRATCVQSDPHDEARRLVNMMLGYTHGKMPARRLAPAAQSVLLSLANGSAATARTLAQATNYSEHTVIRSVREIATEFVDPNEIRPPNGNWTFVRCDELAKRYRPWLQSVAARTRAGEGVPIPALSAVLLRGHTKPMTDPLVLSVSQQSQANQERGLA